MRKPLEIRRSLEVWTFLRATWDRAPSLLSYYRTVGLAVLQKNEVLSSFYDFMGKLRHRGWNQTSVAEPSCSLSSFQLQLRSLNGQKYSPSALLHNCQ